MNTDAQKSELMSRLVQSNFVQAKIKAAKELIANVGVPRKKGTLVDRIAKEAGITKTQAANALNSVIGTIQETLAVGGKVTLTGLGTFTVSQRVARNGRNPRTGKEIKIKPKKVAKFKAGGALSKRVNK